MNIGWGAYSKSKSNIPGRRRSLDTDTEGLEGSVFVLDAVDDEDELDELDEHEHELDGLELDASHKYFEITLASECWFISLTPSDSDKETTIPAKSDVSFLTLFTSVARSVSQGIESCAM